MLYHLDNREARRIQRSRHYRAYKETVRWRAVLDDAMREHNIVKARFALRAHKWWDRQMVVWALALLPKVRGRP